MEALRQKLGARPKWEESTSDGSDIDSSEEDNDDKDLGIKTVKKGNMHYHYYDEPLAVD